MLRQGPLLFAGHITHRWWHGRGQQGGTQESWSLALLSCYFECDIWGLSFPTQRGHRTAGGSGPSVWLTQLLSHSLGCGSANDPVSVDESLLPVEAPVLEWPTCLPPAWRPTLRSP